MNPDSPLTPEQENSLSIELSRIAEQFDLDSLQLCGTAYTPGKKGMTQMVSIGIGNIYARVAATERWCHAVRLEFEDMDCDDGVDVFFEADDNGDDFLGNTP